MTFDEGVILLDGAEEAYDVIRDTVADLELGCAGSSRADERWRTCTSGGT